MSARICIRLNGFFLQFRERITNFYPELFGEQQGGSEYSEQGQFGQKWGWYSSVYALAKGDVREFESILRMRLHECLLFLCFEKEKNELEAKLIKRQSKW